MNAMFKILTLTALIGLSFLAGCSNPAPTPVSPSPTPTPTRNESPLPTTAALNIPGLSGSAIAIPRGTQGQFGNVRIGVASTMAAEYAGQSGAKQYGMTADIQLFAKEGAKEYKTVYLGQTFDFGGYTFFVEEIRPTHNNPGDPPGTSGGGLVGLLCISK